MFLIYALGVDNGDEERFNRAYYREAGRPKFIWGVPKRATSELRTRARECEQRLTRFFEQTLRKEQP